MSNNIEKNNTLLWGKMAMLLIGCVLVVRLISLFSFPLMDTTEARYGEMARIMAETGDWITPMFDYNVPFWGKPPIFTWISAAGIELFGINEFAVRVPHLLLTVLMLVMSYWFVNSELKNKVLALTTVAITATSAVFIVVGGSVMTDTALTLAITLGMMSFWKFSQSEVKSKEAYGWGLFFAVAMSIGMLSKGPLTLVLVGISLFGWLAFNNQWRLLLSFPWISSLGLFFVLSVPWYIAAELKTPGFLDYFIVGEHFKRFVVSGWEGDLYGSAHKEARGMIWVHWLGAALPWSPLLIWQTIKGLRSGDASEKGKPSLRSFLWCWMLAPMILFTMSGNILASYTMPAIPAMAILVAMNINFESKKQFTLVKICGLSISVILIIVTGLLGNNLTSKQAEKGLLTSWKLQSNHTELPLYYVGKRPFSGQFYSDGLAQQVTNKEEITIPSYVVIDTKRIESINGCNAIADSKRRRLLYCP